MTYRTKLIFIVLLPLILISAATIFVVNFQSARLTKSQGAIIEKMYLELKQAELKNYIQLARGAVAPMYNSTLKSERQAKHEATKILRRMSYGADNYFFVFDDQGTNIVNPRFTYLVGNNWLGLKTDDGKQVISDLIKVAKDGGGFYEHSWLKPSTGQYVDKLDYAIYFPKWNWMLGTGIYLDDVAQRVGSVQGEMQNSIKQTRLVLLLLSIGAIIVTSIILGGVQLSEQRLADGKLKALATRLVDIQENERKRVSRELHDSISQLLVSARYGIETAQSNTRRSSKVYQPIEKSMQALDTAINEVRRISMDLRPSVLDDMGLAAAIKGLGAEFKSHNNFDVAVHTDTVHNLLSDKAKTALYRVVQEALTNVTKHTNAQNVSVKLTKERRRIHLDITDDGTDQSGITKLKNTAGLGIRNMQERIDSFGGSIRFSDIKPHGLKISVTLPIERDRSKSSY